MDTLVCDDAAEFNWLPRAMMLCWVHDGWLYKKLEPIIALHRGQLEDFRKSYWAYYDQLVAYREKSTAQSRTQLEAQFDELSASHAGYYDLDQRIAKTRVEKTSLLWVPHPFWMAFPMSISNCH